MITLKNQYVHPTHVKNFKAKEDAIIFALDSMNVNSLATVYKALLALKRKDGLMKRAGICTNLFVQVECILEDYQYARQVTTLMTLWKHYSGRRSFPIPNPNNCGKENSAQIYNIASDSGLLWSTTRRYGRLRHNLLNFLIACIYLVLKERASYMTTEIKFED